MTTAKHVQTYQRTGILTARPEGLQLILYDGAQRFCEQARLALVANDRETACACLDRARRIILYLSACLRPEVAPDLCALVASVYQFVYHRLVDGALNGSPEAVEEAVGVLGELRQAWAELLSQCAPQAEPAPQLPAADARIRLTG
jgi:flagellar protein FliS